MYLADQAFSQSNSKDKTYGDLWDMVMKMGAEGRLSGINLDAALRLIQFVAGHHGIRQGGQHDEGFGGIWDE